MGVIKLHVLRRMTPKSGGERGSAALPPGDETSIGSGQSIDDVLVFDGPFPGGGFVLNLRISDRDLPIEVTIPAAFIQQDGQL